ncbi:MAG: hypothetical protein H6854_02755 [Rhodospirillales bacterium]|nr:hypothetical protein [Rhodospirillales bacterium]
MNDFVVTEDFTAAVQLPVLKNSLIIDIKNSGHPPDMDLAIFLASTLMYGHKDAAGVPKIVNCLEVALDSFLLPQDKLQQTIGYITDNTDWDFDDLAAVGFGSLLDRTPEPSLMAPNPGETAATNKFPLSKEDLICSLKASGVPADLDMAIYIAANAFFGHDLRNDDPYTLHCLKVGLDRHLDPEQQIMGCLHDLIENCGWTLDDIRTLNFSERVVAGLDSLTKRPEEGGLNFDYIERLSLNPDVINVKLLDNAHNSDLTREVELLTPKRIEKQNVYIVQREYLKAVKSGEIEPGSPVFVFMQSREKLHNMDLYFKYGSKPVAPQDYLQEESEPACIR